MKRKLTLWVLQHGFACLSVPSVLTHSLTLIDAPSRTILRQIYSYSRSTTLYLSVPSLILEGGVLQVCSLLSAIWRVGTWCPKRSERFPYPLQYDRCFPMGTVLERSQNTSSVESRMKQRHHLPRLVMSPSPVLLEPVDNLMVTNPLLVVWVKGTR